MHSVMFLAFALACLLVVGEAGAQGRVDRRALDALTGAPAAAPVPAPAPADQERPQRPRGAAQPRQVLPPPPAAAAPASANSAPAPTMPDAPDPPPTLAPQAQVPATTAPPAPSAPPVPPAPATLLPPLLPLEPPAPPVIPPPLAVPMRPVPPPPIVEVVADAPGIASRTDEGWRITFGPGRAALNPATAQAMREMARGLPAHATVTVLAFAPGAAEDPSTARRLSLERALAARGLLIAEGIASSRIFVRALGANQPAIAAGPPDRVDLVVSSPSGRPAP